jgi:DNA-3-methyladenine glycosylase II
VIPTREADITMDDETLIERMVGIKGIGRWTVKMLPVDDFECVRAIAP